MTVWNQPDLAPGSTGVATVYPWTVDLRTTAGKRQFDIAIAALFRITNWHIAGTIISDPDDDPMTAVTDTINGNVVVPSVDERLFVSDDNFDGSIPGNDTLDIPLPITLAGVDQFELPPPGLSPVIVNLTGIIPFRFRARGATNFKIADSVKLSPLIENVGNVTIRVPAWRGAGHHELTTPLFSSNDYVTANFTITGNASLRYKDANEVAVWNANATSAIDPVTAHVDMRT